MSKLLKSLSLAVALWLTLLAASVWLLGLGPSRVEARPAAALWTPPSPAWRIVVSEDGLYQMTYADLLAAGLDVDHLDPRTFRMFYMGQEIPILVEGEGDGRFDAGDAVLFYGRDIDSLYNDGLVATNRYTGDSIYWLSYGGAQGLRMSSKTSMTGGLATGVYPHKVHLEDNRWYFSAYPFREGADHWYWEWLQVSGPSNSERTYSRSHDWTIHNLSTGVYTGSIAVNMLGYYDGVHHLRIYVNDTMVLDDAGSLSDFQVATLTGAFDQSLLREGSNTIKVELVKDTGKYFDKVYLNWIDIHYTDTLTSENDALAFAGMTTALQTFHITGFGSNDIHLFDVSDYRHPKRIIGGQISGANPYAITFGDAATPDSRYLALTPAGRRSPAAIQAVTPLTSTHTPLDLLDTANGADYILITHADFWEDAKRLAEYRSRDYRVALVDVQQIYDQFNGGMMSAEAIRNFLEYAYRHWTAPAPTMAALMGDGSSDMRQYASAADTFIPPYLALVDPTLGETASDNRYGVMEAGDPVPEIAIGRLPANTADEAAIMVDKIIEYEAGCQCDSWNYQTLFVSDNLEGGGGNFYDFSDRVADGYADPPTNTIKYVPETYSVTKLYLGKTCDLDNPARADECPTQLVSSLNMTGALFVSYVGHAAISYWAKEHLWDQSYVSQLTNGPCLPVILSMTCYEGSFHDPSQTALSEFQVRYPEHGAIASLSSTGFGLASGHDILEKGLLQGWFQEEIKPLGMVMDYAKQKLWDEKGTLYQDLIETYTLLGDPALKVKTDAVCRDTPTAVVAYDLQAVGAPGAVRLSWRTADESNLLAFAILRRRVGESGAFVRVDDGFIFVRGVPGPYRFLDRSPAPDEHYAYRLQIIHTDGRVTWQDIGVAGPQSPPSKTLTHTP